MPPVYRGATEEQFQEWEKLIDSGVPRFEASRLAGTTLRRLSNGDEVRFNQGVELSKERQAAMVEKLIVAQTDRPEPSPQLLALRAKATHPDYREKTEIEVTGKVEHEHRGQFTLGLLAEVAEELGVLEGHGRRSDGALPAVAEIPARSS
jgi:hypothetical protein